MLSGFVGTYEPKLDDKGRLILPAKLRDQLGGELIITRGQERCLYVFPVAEFEKFYETLQQAPLTSKQARAFSRVMLSGAQPENPDKQGRISISANLRSYANLDRDLVVIGAGHRVEIWNAQAWNDYLEAEVDDFSDTAEEIIPGLF
ncbi:division/cell wall cluster transcriptional repressor MraZ [Boudabousia marimammalium]|uniref:Transcriptional regulator MraZ n=1 Tax=Boudabousia marimammalium TaxID=156892 RepID=A0A1Q5PNT7_9ACTO|nr:division/cell wall cluster transcriptional repressor MraZ [Boudabousia marimammalium]OKL49248.1 cell division/cell wall cluster transcriptional repressor MraZ [Boudabousia marimammalium]